MILLAYGNLRGIREAGRVFAVPTYFFIVNMVVADGRRGSTGRSTAPSTPTPSSARAPRRTRRCHIGHPASGLLYGATHLRRPQAFASGGSALTGTEAISNGVSIFRRPESRNARITMVMMAAILGSLVLGVSLLATVTHPVPYESGTPTVISQIAKFVYGTSGLGNLFYGCSRWAPR